MKLENKNIVITGAGRGIGREIAVRCAKEGGNIAAIARTETELKETIEIIKPHNSNSFYLTADISNKDSVTKTFSEISKSFARIDCLINNAGIQSPIGPFAQIDIEKWNYNIEVNLMGTVYCTMEAVKRMIVNRSGKIINFSGGGSTGIRQNFSAYAVAKTAIVKFTETIAAELIDHNIFVNAVAPGAVNTKMLDEVIESKELSGKEYHDALKRKEQGGTNPEIVADLICFLLSDDSDGITGKLISAPWDPWQQNEFRELLKSDKDVSTLRRIDNKYFYKKS